MVMEKLRKRAKLFLWIVVVGFVGWIFFDLGADIVGKRVTKPWQRGIIAEVNGLPVADKIFQQMYSLAYQDSMKAKGRELTDAESYALEAEVWRNLIERLRWAELNRERKLELDDKAIVQLIRSSPPQEVFSDTTFRTEEGEFDYQKYLRALQDPRNLPFFVQYERLLREQIPKDITRYDVLFSVPVSEEDVWYEYKMRFEQVKVKGVGFYFRTVPESLITVIDEDVREFYEQNPDSFRIPPQANLLYVLFNKSPSSEDTLEALERAKAALDEIKAGTPFEEVVSFYSDDASRDEGGDLGWITKRSRWPTLFSHAQETKKGQISGPFLSGYGWNIIRVEDKTPDSVRVKLILVRIRTSPSTRAQIREQVEAFYERAKEIGIEEAAKELEKELRSTGLFSLDRGYIPGLGTGKAIIEFARNGNAGEMSPIIRQPWRFLVAKIKEKNPDRILPFKEARDRAEMLAKNKKRYELAYKAAMTVLDRLKAGQSLEEATRDFSYLNPRIFKSDWITRFDPVPGVGYIGEVVGAAFSLPKGEYSPPIRSSLGTFIVQTMDFKEPERKEMEAQLATYLAQIRNYWAGKVWEAWREELVKTAKVKDYRSFILN